MKVISLVKPIAAGILIALSLNVPAQSLSQVKSTKSGLFEWTGMPCFSSLVKTSVAVSDGGWVVGGGYWNDQSFSIPPLFIKLSSTGENLWQYPSYFEWEVGSGDVIKHTNDGNLFVGGLCMMGCDYGPPGTFLHKIAQDRQVIWKKIFVTENSSPVGDIFESANGQIFVLAGKQMLKVSANGDSLGFHSFPMLDQDEFTTGLASEDFLLLGHMTGIFRTDFDGNIISIHDFDWWVRNLVETENGFVFIAGTRIIKTDHQLNVIDDYDFSGLIPPIEFNSTVSDDKFIIAGNGHILQVDFNLQTIADNNYETPGNFEVTTIASNNNLVLMSGNDKGSALDNALAAKTYMLDGTTQNIGVDAGIINLRVENVLAIRYPNYPFVYDFKWDAYATFKNFGNEIINSTNLVSDMVAFGFCSSWYYIIPQTGLLVYPGNSIEIPLGEMKDFGLYYPNQTTAYYNWKMHTMIPNGFIDRNPSNDEISITFPVDLTVGINENSEPEIRIYPNPASESLNIEIPGSGGFGWAITTITGKTLLNGSSDADNTKVGTGNLPTGFYFIGILKDGKRIRIEKLMISE